MQDQSRIKNRQSNDHDQACKRTYKTDQSHSTEKISDMQQDQERAKDDQAKEKQTYQLKPIIDPITCTDKAKYKSSNKKTAKVTTSGKITAVKGKNKSDGCSW